MTTKGHCMERVNDDYANYAPPHPDSEAAAALYNSEPAIPFAFEPRYEGSPSILTG